jgi:hypothetical protein
MLALVKLMHAQRPSFCIAKQRANDSMEALGSLKRHLIRREYHLLRNPKQVLITVLIDMEA